VRACLLVHRRRVLVLGISGATWSVLDPLTRQGRLPHLESLRSRGMSAVALSDRAPGEAQYRPQVAWATAATGRTATNHGITRFFHEGRDLRVPTLWDYWLQAGLRVGVHGWPGTWPPKPCSGFIIPSHLARDERAWPPELARLRELEQRNRSAERRGLSPADVARSLRLLAELHRYGVRARTWAALPSLALRMAAGDSEKTALALRQVRLELATDVFIELCRRFQPSFRAFITFLVDFASHRYWRYYEPSRFTPEPAAPTPGLRRAVPDAYERVDLVLGRLLETVADDCIVLVVSEHGMAAEPDSTEVGSFRFVLRPESLASFASADASIAGCPIARWVAFRQPDGGDATALARLGATLSGMRLLSNGRPLLEVWDRDDEVVVRLAVAGAAGAQDDDAGAIVESNGRRTALGQLVRRLGRTRSAMHDGEGVAILAGPGVPRASARDVIRLVDLAPTLLTLAGLPVPPDLEGCALFEHAG